jgi:uncharacterized protein (DUF1501 family)
MSLNRREFLIGSTTLTLLGTPFFSARAQAMTKRNLIIVMLRGGMDGLTAVPSNEGVLKSLRPDIVVRGVNRLTSDFSLHPQMQIFHDLWKGDQAAVVHATNIPYVMRSHFEGQNLMETGAHVPYGEYTGWLGRGLEAAEMTGLSLSLPMPLLLRAKMAADNFYPSRFGVPREDILRRVAASFDEGSLLDVTMRQILERPRTMMMASGRRDALNLARTAALEMNKAGGPRVAVFDIDGFDTHAAQGGDDGAHGEKLREVDDLFGALRTGLGAAFADSLILTLTEFGRKVEQNGGYGTEHGYGTAILMAGGLLKKAQVHADWPGLRARALFEGRDLNATLDARAVYCAAMAACFGVDFEYLRRKVFWGEALPDLTERLFRV